MSRLKLTDIKKTYRSAETVYALKGISLEFRESEFVSILGPSGCGKTTLLNLIGGLDRYDEGDLTLGGLSTKSFKDADWDAYRNHSVGFVFQNYNLIAHQSVQQNVEMALTLSGVSPSERKARAKQALESVGLGDKLNKKPNQLSGGQMQRVAIARALVNNPEIVLADEPTGALDSQTSVQVMELLKEISKTRLVVMVTHNGELARQYSSRVIHLLDGEMQSDSNPLMNDRNVSADHHAKASANRKQPLESGGATADSSGNGTWEATSSSRGSDKASTSNIRSDKTPSSAGGKPPKTSMSLATASALSFKNLMTKKGRTFITSFAGSIGIIGVALVLALSTGLSGYMSQMQSETLSGFPITISENVMPVQMGHTMDDNPLSGSKGDGEKFPSSDVLIIDDAAANTRLHVNKLTDAYFDYIDDIENKLPDAVNAVTYNRGIEFNLLAKGGEDVVKFAGSSSMADSVREAFEGSEKYWQELPANSPFILSLYDLIGEGSRMPAAADEIAIVVDEFNQLDKAFFEKLGLFEAANNVKLSDFIGKTLMKVVPNDSYYTSGEDGLFVPATASRYAELYDGEEGLPLTVTGILRVKESAADAVGYLSEGIVYTTALTQHVLDEASASAIAEAQRESDRDVITNAPFPAEAARKEALLRLGADATPTGISIYPVDFDAKDEIKAYLDSYNDNKPEDEIVAYSDLSELVGATIQTMLNTVSYVLIGFAAISLVVSTIMIGIITYVSVLERTKEIGILRSIGARKKDISRVFNAETLIVGLTAGMMGIVISYLLTLPINSVISRLVGIEGVAELTPLHAAALVLGSMLLTLIAGLLPARMAAKKDPVIALRTE